MKKIIAGVLLATCIAFGREAIFGDMLDAIVSFGNGYLEVKSNQGRTIKLPLQVYGYKVMFEGLIDRDKSKQCISYKSLQEAQKARLALWKWSDTIEGRSTYPYQDDRQKQIEREAILLNDIATGTEEYKECQKVVIAKVGETIGKLFSIFQSDKQSPQAITASYQPKATTTYNVYTWANEINKTRVKARNTREYKEYLATVEQGKKWVDSLYESAILAGNSTRIMEYSEIKSLIFSGQVSNVRIGQNIILANGIDSNGAETTFIGRKVADPMLVQSLEDYGIPYGGIGFEYYLKISYKQQLKLEKQLDLGRKKWKVTILKKWEAYEATKEYKAWRALEKQALDSVNSALASTSEYQKAEIARNKAYSTKEYQAMIKAQNAVRATQDFKNIKEIADRGYVYVSESNGCNKYCAFRYDIRKSKEFLAWEVAAKAFVTTNESKAWQVAVKAYQTTKEYKARELVNKEIRVGNNADAHTEANYIRKGAFSDTLYCGNDNLCYTDGYHSISDMLIPKNWEHDLWYGGEDFNGFYSYEYKEKIPKEDAYLYDGYFFYDWEY
ncbi:hypothetical protein [Helicobacter sp. MIT 01-3238]|uniref:hypothetical protein n=1 Tax=Helicobacter sp. MIT 01-3238 TaxID=398627 RepID=UPI000E1E4609|nr:hypothetical protein [Helicobacter sp. MIT 01-3238]RDU53529.1 hypothetical protein CQA40_05265 [Helicobacter sp. MIT 01-3238]